MAKPFVGAYVQPDGWNGIGGHLKNGDGPQGTFPGCDYRLPSAHNDLAVNVTITGKARLVGNLFKHRCRIEFVGHDEPSTFSGGWIYLSYVYQVT
jgi:hypothetical protein